MPANLPFYLYPVGGYEFGEITATGTRHDGLDLGTPTGTPLTDILPGTATITKAGFFPWGGEVDVTGKTRSGQPFTEVLAHLDKIFVKQGQTVSAGQTVGLSGGENLPPQYSDGPHTHLGFFEGGQAISPRAVLDALGLGTASSNGVTQDGTAGQGGTSDGQTNAQGQAVGDVLGGLPTPGSALAGTFASLFPSQAVGIGGAISDALTGWQRTIQADLERAGFFILALVIIVFGGLVLFWPSIEKGAGTAAKAVAL